MGRVTQRAPSTRVEVLEDGSVRSTSRPDTLAVEEPLEIRVAGHPVTVTMRTPGDDFDLTLGNLLTEGVVTKAVDVAQLMHCLDEDESGSPTYNVVDVTLAAGVVPDLDRTARSGYQSSACGVCGKTSVDAITATSPYAVADDAVRLSPAVVAVLPDRLRERQKVFDRTGGLHAAGIFTAEGEPLVVREDVGRHNAVDKVVGWAGREGLLPLTGHVLVVSGRASFELVQKAVMAGIPALVAVSAPSSLAVQLATESGLTLVGFTRPPRMTVYAGGSRLGL
ncbi:formate dehydrogenase accessory sulfurtransferase FdhD [Phycicoccus sp. M110.8]|uniref:formate dehydrogenase accessory sulfurtransferase FdhD n=1 Tax=Phycicoccus sp. M110.8 TaxID=3075433 RepID=UPI0028FD6AC4|nr:formate dehydrogenase accessory sulfurtransferase FdhD [Phycicoccus sp. M110.8]MDU0312120.1 formate dehydrogenase accessory sulfurtransferase FdhD [Phycicoccus sp. M110.8]